LFIFCFALKHQTPQNHLYARKKVACLKMAKSSGAYRREASDACTWHQEQALTSTIYIVYQTGPTGFLLKEEGEHRDFKVVIMAKKR
jgi:hypothetical protein